MPSDDSTIDDETLLYRRLHPTQLIWDENRGRIRATRNAFKDTQLSIALGDELEALGRDPAWTLRVDPQHQVGYFSAAFARAEEQAVWRDPLFEHPRYGEDPTHGIVEGAKPGARRNIFVDACAVLILKPGALSPELRSRLA